MTLVSLLSFLLFVVLLGPILVALSLTAVNLLSWSRGRPERIEARVSLLVPARNEAARIERCLRSLADGIGPRDEIIVYDDQSTDETAALVERLGAEIPRLRLLRGDDLPAGWVGKPHACHRLAAAARGELFVFVDADVELEPGGLSRLVSLLGEAQVASAVPLQRMKSFAERLIMPLLHLTYTSWLPLALVSRSADPRIVAANGQLLAIRRHDLERIGGFSAVAGEIVDDVALCRLAKQRGLRVAFGDGAAMASCRMYASGRALWRGFSKNVYEGLGSTLALVVAIALYLAAFVLPYVALVVGLAAVPALVVPAAIGVGANIALRGLLAWRFHHPWEGLLLHPLAVLSVVAIALNSMRWARGGRLEWAGRRYGARRDRLALREAS